MLASVWRVKLLSTDEHVQSWRDVYASLLDRQMHMGELHKYLINSQEHMEKWLESPGKMIEHLSSQTEDSRLIDVLRQMLHDEVGSEVVRLLLRSSAETALFGLFIFIDERRSFSSDSEAPLEFWSQGSEVVSISSFHEEFSYAWHDHFSSPSS